MDPNGNIYRAPEDEIPAEDKARLEGFLRGRAEADAPNDRELLDEIKAAAYDAKVRAMQEAEGRG